MKVLIVDDHESCLVLLQRLLDSMPGVTTTAASNACEAWWHLSDPRQSFDLLIADVNMPVIGGLELTRRIRSYPSLKKTSIILCSAANDRKTIESFQQLGVSHYVVKPFDLTLMREKIRRSLGLSAGPADPPASA
jgi:CheY-like chemotaxis protein